MKKLHRFFLPNPPRSEIFEISDNKLVHQLSTVLRYAVGESFIVFSEGTDDTVLHIKEITKKSIVVSVEALLPAQKASPVRTIAIVSIIKRDLFELVVQKLTELGISEIVPLLSTRTVKQSIRIERLQDISREAVEQSGRNSLVAIHEPLTLSQCLEQFPFPSIVFDPRENESDYIKSDTLVFYIGPEGGWSEEDEAVFKQHAVTFRKLAPTILRTETAAIVGAYTILNT